MQTARATVVTVVTHGGVPCPTTSLISECKISDEPEYSSRGHAFISRVYVAQSPLPWMEPKGNTSQYGSLYLFIFLY